MEGEGADEGLPSSPSHSSLSSSDLDTESTGSFFPDRSTSLGTLMGVSFPSETASARRDRPRPSEASPPPLPPHRRHPRRSGNGRGRKWWMLCREEDMTRRTSLGDFLRVERRVGYVPETAAEHNIVGGAPLFADGRVLPPAVTAPPRSGRLPVVLIGICSGGEG